MSGVATPKRVDPKPRPVEGPAGEFSLVGTDPGRFYAAINMTATGRFGPQGYLEAGYQIETQRADGPRFRFGITAKPGQPIEYQGHVLMSCTNERKAEIELYGAFGGAGQEEVDRIHNLMVNKRAGRSVLGNLRRATGPSGEPLFDVENETGHQVGVSRL